MLVEGRSDRTALLTLAGRLGRDLAAEGVEVVAMDGITNTRAFALRYGPRGLVLRLAGLYDSGEESTVRRGLAAAGVGDGVRPRELAHLGFYACTVDLEDELIRALGADGVEAVIDAAGETLSLRRLAQMPAQRDRPREALLHRFIGVRAGRKERYARLLVEALDLAQAPRPLTDLLGRV